MFLIARAFVSLCMCVCTLACTSLFRIWFIVRFLLFATLFADISLGIVLIAAVFLAIARLLAVDDVDAIAHIIFPIVKTSHRRSGYQKRISPFVWLSSAIRNHLTLTWSHFHSLCGQFIGSVLSISFPLHHSHSLTEILAAFRRMRMWMFDVKERSKCISCNSIPCFTLIILLMLLLHLFVLFS